MQKQPKRDRLWLNDGSCVRLRPEHKNHVWSYDFVLAGISDGRAFRTLAVLDEYTDVTDQLYQLFLLKGMPEYIRSDNGPEFTRRR